MTRPTQEWEAARRLRDCARRGLAIRRLPIPVLWPVAVAGYFPLHSLPGAQALLDRDWPAAVAALLVQQVREPAEEAQIRASLPALTVIDDDVSLMVRRQYEENPYPRWVRAPASVPATLRPAHAAAIPAGAIPRVRQARSRRPDRGLRHRAGIRSPSRRCSSMRDVLAIDLSASSLGYAMRKIARVRIAQYRLHAGGHSAARHDRPDIRRHRLDRRTAPPRGSLGGLARPRLAAAARRLHAHRSLQRARRAATSRRRMAFIAERGYGRSADDIRRCRQELADFPADTPQRRVTIQRRFLQHQRLPRSAVPRPAARIRRYRRSRNSCDANGLAFLGFELDARVLRTYALRFPEDPARTNLRSLGRVRVREPVYLHRHVRVRRAEAALNEKAGQDAGAGGRAAAAVEDALKGGDGRHPESAARRRGTHRPRGPRTR